MSTLNPVRQTILVVDDTPDNILILVDLLKDLFRVKVANGGARALDIAFSGEPPDLILLDVMMPEMDGYEVCRRLKADEATREIPVLFVTAMGEVQDEARGFALGAVDYITKPYSPALVLARVRTQLEQARLLAAERELLEKTLKGALAVLLEMVELANPDATAWHQRLSELAEQVARTLGMAEPWLVGLAAVLSRIGTLTVPEGILRKVKAKTVLNTEERKAYARVPEVGYRLLRNIPRLEAVAEMVHYAQKNFSGSGFPPDEVAGEAIPLGGRILRVCLDFMYTTQPGDDLPQRAGQMLYNTSLYDPDVVFALKKVLDAGAFAAQAEAAGERQVPLAHLDEGQVLSRSIETVEGQTLLLAGTVLGPGHLEKIANFAMIGAVVGPFWIQE